MLSINKQLFTNQITIKQLLMLKHKCSFYETPDDLDQEANWLY